MKHKPHPYVTPNYGAKIQYNTSIDYFKPLDEEVKKFIMQVTGTLLNYARSVDETMLTALSVIASEQSAPTEPTINKCKQFLNYAATQPDAILTY